MASKSVAEGAASVAVVLTLAAAPAPEVEASYRRHVNVVVERGLDMIEPTCAELGPRSPVYGWCELAGVMAEPWNRETRSFDFSRLVPAVTSTKGEKEKWVDSILAPSVMTFYVVAAGFGGNKQNDYDIAFWKGVGIANLIILITLPFMAIFILSTIFFLFLDLRWAVVKRVNRIAR